MALTVRELAEVQGVEVGDVEAPCADGPGRDGLLAGGGVLFEEATECLARVPSSMGERYMPEYYPGGSQAGGTSPG